MNKDKEQKSDENSDHPPFVQSKFLRGVLIFIGTLCVVLGVIGIFLPILPTTPFLLLAAWCYARSSKRYYNWLISNKIFGKYIKDYHEGKGIPRKAKIAAIVLLWLTILFSVFFIVFNIIFRIIMIITAILVSVHIISIKTKR